MFAQIDVQDNFLVLKNYFVYRKKEFGFDIDLFKRSSMYFQDNFNELQEKKYINLIKQEYEHIIELTEDSINDFIKYCHNQKISISIDNVISLNYLAKQFTVNNLIKITDKIILDHKSELALQLISFYNDIDDSNKEDIISENFFEYINKDQIFLLQIPTLHRILKKNLQIFEKEDQNSNKEKLIEFLFQCLSKFGRRASVLFGEINFEKIDIKYLNRLLTEFSDIFDFHFLNMTFLKKNFEIQNETIKYIEIQKKLLNDQKLLNEENDKIKIQISHIQKVMNDYEQMKNENKDVHKQLTEIQKEIDKTKNENQAINEKLNDLSNENQKLKNEIKNLDSKLADLTNENQKLRSQNGSFDIKIDNIINENHSYKNEIQTLRNEIQTLKMNLRSVSNDNHTLINENQEIKRNIGKIDINTQSSITKINNALSNGRYALNIQYDKLKPFDGIINYFTQRKGLLFSLLS